MGDEVREATAALKGILGIGGVGASKFRSSSTSQPRSPVINGTSTVTTKSKSSTSAKKVTKKAAAKIHSNKNGSGANKVHDSNHESGLSPTQHGPKTTKPRNTSHSTKSNKNSNNRQQVKNPPKQKPQHHQHPQNNGVSSKQKNSKNVKPHEHRKKNNSPARPKQHHDYPSTSPHKKKLPPEDRDEDFESGGGMGAKKNSSETFAWSTWQTSAPDASTLPIPMFGSPISQSSRRKVSEGGSSIGDNDVPNNNILETITRHSSAAGMQNIVPTTSDGALTSAEQLEERMFAASKAAAKKKEDISEPTTAAHQEGENSKKKNQSKQTKRDSAKENDDKSSSSSAPNTISGVNLAALSSNKSSTKEMDPIAQLMSRSTIQQLHHQSPSQMHQFPNVYSPPPPNYNQQSTTLQQHQQAHVVTIQVQVPPLLLPGRQMMVHTPAGYPIPVVVPEHVPPGAVIPVNVPTLGPHSPPPNFHPPSLFHPPHADVHGMQHQQQFSSPPQNKM